MLFSVRLLSVDGLFQKKKNTNKIVNEMFIWVLAQKKWPIPRMPFDSFQKSCVY